MQAKAPPTDVLPPSVKILSIAEAHALGISSSVSYGMRHTVAKPLLAMLETLHKGYIPAAIVCIRGVIGEGAAIYEVWRKPREKVTQAEQRKGLTKVVRRVEGKYAR